MNERFTRLADVVSEAIGTWQVVAVSFLVVLAWLALGPFLRWSDTWQLLINTPTTVLEMWLGFLIAAAANRVQRQQEAHELMMEEMLRGVSRLLERLEAEEQDELALLKEAP